MVKLFKARSLMTFVIATFVSLMAFASTAYVSELDTGFDFARFDSVATIDTAIDNTEGSDAVNVSRTVDQLQSVIVSISTYPVTPTKNANDSSHSYFAADIDKVPWRS